MNFGRPQFVRLRLFPSAVDRPRSNVPKSSTIKSISSGFTNSVVRLISILVVSVALTNHCTADENARPAHTPARCTVRKSADGWWLVDPTGKPFFSLGICEFNQGIDKHDADHPSYAG